jgi:hypothetical protein
LPVGVHLIITRSVIFEVALDKTGEDQRGENNGDSHNPTLFSGV